MPQPDQEVKTSRSVGSTAPSPATRPTLRRLRTGVDLPGGVRHEAEAEIDVSQLDPAVLASLDALDVWAAPSAAPSTLGAAASTKEP